ncbi:D-2-hydroxyacid dehydrogenase family protein [Lentzea sp. BCCO 10_0856]|uniref:D-2-hydroxyacid dehydrogenase family protein n=1 Tax=Lentzea miocenica TaxID=3095431 RepID=A0ABU4SWR3_9PSEU|nr:D-2-hydroxyacid dehydrogenase family protein [Lentzea sp. BCCO 10_0856]MDX8030249.1 D-2-hydroxyacid dehydrogenase family protein [Lentzea sp. BCCO 10_0856]
MRCVVLDDYQGVALANADWSGLDVTVVRDHLDDPAQALAEAECVVIMRERTPFTASLFARLSKLRLLITSGMRNASIDLEAAREHGVTVCGTGSAKTPPAELTWALILGLARHLAVENAAFHDGGPWQSTVGVDLAGATLGLVGFGHLGKAVGRVGKAFGMDVVAWSQNLTPDRTEAEGVRLASSLHELLGQSDFASVHLVLSDRTRGLLDAAALACLKPSAFLINTSRAAVVDQVALLDVLRDNRIAGAGLDVFETEPLPLGDELRTLPNVLATPHLGYVTQANYRAYFQEAVEDVHAFLRGAPIRELAHSR